MRAKAPRPRTSVPHRGGAVIAKPPSRGAIGSGGSVSSDSFKSDRNTTSDFLPRGSGISTQDRAFKSKAAEKKDNAEIVAATLKTVASSRPGCEITYHGGVKFLWHSGTSDAEQLKKTQNQDLKGSIKTYCFDSTRFIRYQYFHGIDGYLVFYTMHCFEGNRLMRICRSYPGVDGQGNKLVRVYILHDDCGPVTPSSWFLKQEAVTAFASSFATESNTSFDEGNGDRKGKCCSGNGSLACPLFQRLAALCSSKQSIAPPKTSV